MSAPSPSEIESLLRARRHQEAVLACRHAIQSLPSAELWNLLGKALAGAGDTVGAEAAFGTAIDLDGTNEKPIANLANLLCARGDLTGAITLYERALTLRPDVPRILAGLGGALEQVGRLEEAREALTRAHDLDPKLGVATVRLARLVLSLEGEAASERVLLDALGTEPNVASVVGELGSLLHGAGRIEQAAPHLERAFVLEPGSAALAVTLGDNLRQRFELTRAVSVLEGAIRIDPTLAEAHLALGFVFAELGRHADFERHYEVAARAGVASAAAQSIRLYYLLNDERQTREAIKRAHVEASESLGAAEPVAISASRPTRGRRLRIGYASPDFRVHVVGLFMEGVIRAHDPLRVEVALISSTQQRDAATDHFATLAPLHDLHAASDEAFVERVRALDLDVLVDLAGHTRDHRLAAFARRVAPVQATYLGYPSTTGVRSFDFRITDALTDPPGAEEEFVERLYRLPDLAWSYAPWAPTAPPEVSPRSPREVVFGCFNRREKIGPSVIEAWKRILDARPTARLVLKAKAFADAGVCKDLIDALGQDAGQRVRFEAWCASPAANYEAYRGIDVALDTYPYNGTTTTCDALWMGVPVVTLQGLTSASRVGHALAHAVRLDDLATSSVDAYVEAALQIADDEAMRAELRRDLRRRITRGPLGDPKRLARQLEDAYQSMVDLVCA